MVRLNTDIFDSNVINIVILLIGILYLGFDFFSGVLSTRREVLLTLMEKEELNLKKSYYVLSQAVKEMADLRLFEQKYYRSIVEQNELLETAFYKRLEKIVCIGKIQESRNSIVAYRKEAFRLVYGDIIFKALMNAGKLFSSLEKRNLNILVTKLHWLYFIRGVVGEVGTSVSNY
jgi:hypothetical protein